MNEMTEMNTYSELTLDKLVEFVMSHPNAFPRGMKTKIVCADFEGNYYHQKFELMKDGTNVCLGFELHEN